MSIWAVTNFTCFCFRRWLQQWHQRKPKFDETNDDIFSNSHTGKWSAHPVTAFTSIPQWISHGSFLDGSKDGNATPCHSAHCAGSRVSRHSGGCQGWIWNGIGFHCTPRANASVVWWLREGFWGADATISFHCSIEVRMHGLWSQWSHDPYGGFIIKWWWWWRGRGSIEGRCIHCWHNTCGWMHLCVETASVDA